LSPGFSVSGTNNHQGFSPDLAIQTQQLSVHGISGFPRVIIIFSFGKISKKSKTKNSVRVRDEFSTVVRRIQNNGGY
jgi:hypothetical protein